MRCIDFTTFAMLTLAGAAPALADITWDEFVDGALSGNPDTPTPLVLGLGSNTVIG